jgi:membrane protein YqaA with SNARE-associated domain
MPDFEDPFQERLSKMPWAVATCAVVGTMLGLVVAALIAAQTGGVGVPRFLFLMLAGIGFVLGVVVGVTLDTLVFKPMRDRKAKRERRRRRQREKETEGRWGP